MKLKDKNIAFVVFLGLLSGALVFGAAAGCSNYPVLSELANSRTKLILKGTYESNSPYSWQTVLFDDDSLASGSLPASEKAAVNFADINLNIDIAAIRVARPGDTLSQSAPEDYWEYFAEHRTLFCAENKDANNRPLIDCIDQNGTKNLSKLFTSGYSYPVIDLPAGKYSHLAIYFRKFVIGPAVQYSSSGTLLDSITSIFDNRSVYGIDLAQEIIQYRPGSATDDPLMFPLERKNFSLVVPNNSEPIVFEVRFFVKNNLMHYGMEHGDKTSSITPISFVGPSDWAYNYQYDNISNGYRLGGNIIMTARLYEENHVGSIDIVDSVAPAANMEYYAVVQSGATFDPAQGVLPYAATSVSASGGGGSAGTVTNLPAGAYDIYKTCDIQQQSASGLIAGADGYPEKATFCGSATVTEGAAATANVNCTCL